jgi:hypothetical protein
LHSLFSYCTLIFVIAFQEKDLSLKDSAGYCLRKVAPAVCLKYQDVTSDVEFLVSDTILLLARVGIRDKNETVQQESVKLLGEMVSSKIWNLVYFSFALKKFNNLKSHNLKPNFQS